MDPGTALGVVSLGIQVCQGIVRYYNGWKDCPADVASAVQAVESLRKTLAYFTPILEDDEIDDGIKARVEECISSCLVGIKQLDEERQRFESPSKVKRALLRGLYPFKASTLAKLKEAVGDLLGQLSVALQLLDLSESNRGHQSSRAAVAEARNEIASIANIVDVISDGVARIELKQDQTASSIEHLKSQNDLFDQRATGILGATKDVSTGLDRILSAQESQKLENILRWLAAPDVAVDHDAACRRREHGTGEWFLASSEYLSWQGGHDKILWLHGKAGCCKTVLTSTIVEDMRLFCAQRPTSAVVYFYFTFSNTEKQHLNAMLRAVVAQLAQSIPDNAALHATFDGNRHNAPTTTVLENLLSAMTNALGQVYLIIDALDESPNSDAGRPDVYESLRMITELHDNLSILITSRRESDIEDSMQQWAAKRVSIDTTCVNKDIAKFVTAQLQTGAAFQRLDAYTKQLITDTLSQKADGMFRWAYLQVESLRKLRVKTRPRIEDVLRSLPQDLDATYERMLAAFEPDCVVYVSKALRWLSFANRLLTIDEVAEAMSSDFTSGPEDEDRGEPLSFDGALELLSPFIIILPPIEAPEIGLGGHGMSAPIWSIEKPIGGYSSFSEVPVKSRLRLAHFSVKEYLVSDRITQGAARQFAIDEQESRCILTRSCLRYVIDSANSGQSRSWLSTPCLDEERPLLYYAANEWCKSPRLQDCACGDEDKHFDLELALLDCNRCCSFWFGIWSVDYPVYTRTTRWINSTDTYGPPPVLYFASFLGLASTVRKLVEAGADVNQYNPRDKKETVLHVAAMQGHIDIVRYLIDHGADGLEALNLALRGAVYHAREQVTDLLLSHGAGTSRHDANFSRDLFDKAVTGGSRHIVKRIWELETGERLALYSHESLCWACRTGLVEKVELLLDLGADVNARNGAALARAVEYNKRSVVKLLLRRGVKVDPTGHGGTILHSAAVKMDQEMFQLLLDHGADIKAERASCKGSLHDVIRKTIDRDRPEVLKLLYKHGADVSAVIQDARYLALAAVHCDKEMVEALIDLGADVNGGLEPPLLLAVGNGREEIADILLRHGADIGVLKDYKTADKYKQERVEHFLKSHSS